jgi:hypothetical protein
MSKITINELQQSSDTIQLLSPSEANNLTGGRVTISITSGASSSASASSESYTSYSDKGGVVNQYGYSLKTRSENGVELERKLEKFGDFPNSFIFPNF